MSELPQGWAIARIGEICEPSQYGFTAKANSSGTVHFLRTTDITSGYVDWKTVPYCNIQKNDEEKYLLKDGDVVISRAGSVGYSFLLRNPKPSVFASYLIRFRPLVFADYFGYFLKTPAYWEAIGEQSLGIAVQNVNATKLAEIEVPIAPALEQVRIVERLEELLSGLDAGVTELWAAQRKLTQYRQSLLKAAVEGALTADWRADHGQPREAGAELLRRILSERRASWEQKQRAKFAKQDKTPPEGWQAKYPEPIAPEANGLPDLPAGWTWASVDQLSPDDLANGRSVPTAEVGARVLRLTAVRSGKIDLSEWKYGAWTEEEAKAFAISEGDLLIVRGNGSLALVGRAGLVGEVRDQIAYPDTLIRLRILEAVVRPAWISLIWDGELSRSHLEGRARTSAGIYKISQPDIVSVRVPVPPLAEQDQILAKFDGYMEQVGSVEMALETALRQATAQRKNLLKAAFAGQLVPQDPNDEPASELLARIRASREAGPGRTTANRRGRKAKETA